MSIVLFLCEVKVVVCFFTFPETKEDRIYLFGLSKLILVSLSNISMSKRTSKKLVLVISMTLFISVAVQTCWIAFRSSTCLS